MSSSLRPPESQHARPPCPSPTPGVYSNSCSLSWWCYPTISSSVIPFSSCPQSFPASGSFPMSQLVAWGGQSIGVSASTSVLLCENISSSSSTYSWSYPFTYFFFHHQLNRHEFEQTPGNSERQGSLASCRSRGCKETNMTQWLNDKYLQMQWNFSRDSSQGSKTS